MRRTIRNWYSVGLLAAIVLESRIPPRKGLAGTWLGKRVVTFAIADGSKVTCRLQDAGDVISVFVDRDYAPFELNWTDVLTVIDIGATVGCFSLWALRLAPDAQVVAVEPNIKVYPFLVKNLQANGFASRARTLRLALGAVSGYGAVVDKTFSTLATVVPVSFDSPTAVRVVTLDQLMDEVSITKCDLLKIDCEGAEYDLVLGSTNDVLGRFATIVCEFHPRPDHSVPELSKRLEEAGFSVSTFGGPVGFLLAKR
jgi:FkbM family methyltransferase